MAFPASGWFGKTLEDILQNDIAMDLDGDTIKVALFADSMTSPNMATALGTYGSDEWTTTPEIDNSGTYAAGGTALTTPAIAAGSTAVVFSEANASMAWTTFTGTPRGALVYDSTLTPDRGVCAINFGADVPVVSGTLTITWNTTNKIAIITFA